MDERLLHAETIVFDVGNVLLSFDPRKVAQLIPEEHREKMFEAMFGPDYRWGAFDLGAQSNAEIAESIAKAAGVEGGQAMVLNAYDHFPETMVPLPLYGLIEPLKAMGKKLYALTNFGEPAFTASLEAFPKLSLMDGHIVSAREKLVKPDPKIFRTLVSRFSLVPENVLYIDDALPNAEAAAKEGFRVWHYVGADRLPENT